MNAGKRFSVEGYNKLVIELTKELDETVDNKILKLPERQRIIIKSRIVQYFFQKHFGLIIESSSKEVERREKELDEVKK